MQVMPAVVNVMKEESTLVTLVKPQFEARRSQVRSFLLCISYYYFLTPFHTSFLSEDPIMTMVYVKFHLKMDTRNSTVE